MEGNLAMANQIVHQTEEQANTPTYPKGTTKEQWERYYADLKIFEELCEQRKPIPPPLYFVYYKPTPDFPECAETASEAQRIYQKALSQWEMMCSMDAPNKPGYYRANND